MNEADQTADILVAEKFPALTKKAWQDVLSRWDEPHRRWHGREHLQALLESIDSVHELSESDREMLRYVALFHDAIYNPQSASNEEDSAKLAAEALGSYARKSEVLSAILATKTHQSQNELEQRFNEWDCAILSETRWDRLLVYEQGIAFEYQDVEPEVYRRERSRFLIGAAQKYQNPMLVRLADEVASE